MVPYSEEIDYQCWLNYKNVEVPYLLDQYRSYLNNIIIDGDSLIIESIKGELGYAIERLLGILPNINKDFESDKITLIGKIGKYFNWGFRH